MRTHPALRDVIQTCLRPLDRLAHYLNGDDPLRAADEASVFVSAPGVPKKVREQVRAAFRAFARQARTDEREEVMELVKIVQRAPYPENALMKPGRYERISRIRLLADPVWALTLGEFVGNPYRARLRRCENAACQRWFVDMTRNAARRRCTTECTVAVSNAARAAALRRERQMKRKAR